MEKKDKKYYSPRKFINKKKVEKHRSDYIVFFTFLIISASLWLLINLSKEYSLSYNMHVYLNSPPVDRIITKQVDSTITFHVNAQGFFLVKLEFMKPEELVVNVNNYTIQKAEDSIYYISTQPLKENIAELLNISPSKIGFSKNTLSFYMEKLYKKKLKVVPRLTLNFAEFYNLYKPLIIKPESVMAYGPKQVLDTLKEVYTVPVVLDKIKESLEVSLEIDNSEKSFLKIRPEKVQVILDVTKFTQSGVEVPVTNPEKQLNLQTFPSKVKVYYDVALKDYDKVNSSNFTIVPELNNVDLQKVKKLYLKVIRKPDFVRNVRIDPPQVEFIIMK